MAWFLSKLPRGTGLSAEAWAPLHRFFKILLWSHIPATVGFGLLFHHSLEASILAASLLIPFAVLASSSFFNRRVQSVIVSLGLGTASGLFVHLSGGYIEFHFHYFVMVTLLMLYQDWTPFLTMVGFVAIQHGVLGVFLPHSVYNHQAALASPWAWAAIHGTYIAAACIGMVITWRKLEDRVEEAQHDHARLQSLYRTLESEVQLRRDTESALAASHAELERRVTERTAALHDANAALHEANKELRIEAADRMRAEQDLAYANAELKERLQELEHFHDIVVGRELKMMELKKEIEALQRQIETMGTAVRDSRYAHSDPATSAVE